MACICASQFGYSIDGTRLVAANTLEVSTAPRAMNPMKLEKIDFIVSLPELRMDL
jgi:hypothetical protein